MRRALVVLVLVLGVLGMHSVLAPAMAGTAVSVGVHAGTAAESVPMPGEPPMPAHDMQHLCLAVLAAALVLALAATLPAVLTDAVAQVLRTARTAPRRPPPENAVRLAELCVQRT